MTICFDCCADGAVPGTRPASSAPGRARAFIGASRDPTSTSRERERACPLVAPLQVCSGHSSGAAKVGVMAFNFDRFVENCERFGEAVRQLGGSSPPIRIGPPATEKDIADIEL